MIQRTWVLALSAALFATLVGCAANPARTTVADAAGSTPQLTTLNKLVADAGLSETLRAAGPYTVFAPSDEAFKQLPPATLEALGKDKERLKAVLAYHIVPGKMDAAQVQNGSVKTLQGGELALARSGTFVTVEDAMVQQADVPASNGVVHVIDRVLMPPVKK
ncbi:fasciclin domain-containing protein [Aquabacterium sp. A7-Y]|uniref:fasciclin domain-containing protein n=1 Tax=Aquabacterium sp. A7-Y TaxID=1349605 RepID=UPI00223DE6DC|nr:fasciclin domain-containing protein [Aquabacterium sp. A7-Y]MCW7540788.1 fasciclin domain-containing protein [Aquabacterium sp. A7-Y]